MVPDYNTMQIVIGGVSNHHDLLDCPLKTFLITPLEKGRAESDAFILSALREISALRIADSWMVGGARGSGETLLYSLE